MTDELAAQVRELQERMKSMVEERAHHGAQGQLSVVLLGGAQGAVPPQPATASSGHVPAPGTFVILHTRTSLSPIYDRNDKSKYVL